MIPKAIMKLLFGSGCHGSQGDKKDGDAKKIILVGSPNVGKSVMFANLTGTYVTVSNYPGTTVEVSRGTGEIAGQRYEVIDTPGMYSLLPLSEEERVGRRILMQEKPDVVLHLADAKSLERTLMLTFGLMEAGLPVILVVNMMDEATAIGLKIDMRELEEQLGIPVVGTVSTTGVGMDELRRRIAEGAFRPSPKPFLYSSANRGMPIETYISRIEELLKAEYSASHRLLALLLLQEDEETHQLVRGKEGADYAKIQAIVDEALEGSSKPIDYWLMMERHRWATAVLAHAVADDGKRPTTFSKKLSQFMTHPVTGLPIVLLVLYFGLYKFVGGVGAGTAVDFLEGTVFEKWINPYVNRAAEYVIPWQALRNLFAGEYGMVTLGLRYAVAIILPIVTFFFLVFSFIEDVGYLPRLALLLDRMFKKIGLSGRAVIPMVLGLGCATMATLVTRTLSTKRERLIAILLLSVAVPCSAQLGVLMALLSDTPAALLIWAFVIGAVYLAVGFIAAQVVRGRAAPFYAEIPPLRWPKLSNIASKTFARVKWYFKEILPLFLLASAMIWLGRLTGLFQLLVEAMEYPVQWVGLPKDAAEAFLFGFFRRDYGVAGLYDLKKSGALTGVQLVVATVALTLFLPCIAHLLVTAKEKGWKIGVMIAAITLVISLSVAFVLFHVLSALEISL